MERVCPECGEKTDEYTCPHDGEMTLVIKKNKPATLIGDVIGGRYRAVEIIGQGGFGAVYKCTHVATGDTLALKVLRTDVESNADVIARFRQEAKATSRLKHPNTVRVFDFGQMDDGNLFLAMEFLEGRTLTEVMREDSPLEPKRLVKIALQVLKSLSEAHSRGLVHRDLKPDNVFVQNIHGEPDFVRVLDFGIAKSMSTEKQDITSTGAVIGTPKYMSPEQARGQSVDQRTDIYSLGVILYEALTGTPPFLADTPLAMILRRVTEEPPRVHDCLVRPAPRLLCDAVLRSMSRHPVHRFETADEFASALEEGLNSPVVDANSNQTAAYSPSDLAEGTNDDETAAYEAGEVSNASEQIAVVSTGQHEPVDDATTQATAQELEAAKGEIDAGDETVADMNPDWSQLSDDIKSAGSTGHKRKSKLVSGAIVSLLVVGAVVGGVFLSSIEAPTKMAVKAPPGALKKPVVPPVKAKVEPKPSLLTFVRQPKEARVEVSGLMVVKEPHEVTPGVYKVTATAHGYQHFETKIKTVSGPMQVEIRMEPIPKPVPVAATPPVISAAKPVKANAGSKARRKRSRSKRPKNAATLKQAPSAAKPKPKPKPKKAKPKPDDGGLLID
ncbi:MAG TPA: hypothetical protein DCQ06_00630 [Myxococcales bacterium]|nr:hypothetical protein [Myxococcales bacterium]HAN30077.1 hypothetical protein [Myxococcales bacterium]